MMPIQDPAPAASRPGARWWLVPLLSLLFFLLAQSTTGFRSDHLFLVVLVNALYFSSGPTRRFVIGFSVFIVYWILYDSMKAWPNYAFRAVDIAPLYRLEKQLFGISEGSEVLIPSEYFVRHASAVPDLLSGMFYLCWVPVPLLFAFYLFRRQPETLFRFSLAFFVINLLGFVIYYLHPAAAPWYVEQYGFHFDPAIRSNAAGLLRVDRRLGFGLFEGIYSKGSNVFAAMPSLHAAYPLAGFYYSLRQPLRWIRVAFGFLMCGIWVSAVYLSHHYVLDVLAGIACGVSGIVLCEGFLFRQPAVQRWLSGMVRAVQAPGRR